MAGLAGWAGWPTLADWLAWAGWVGWFAGYCRAGLGPARPGSSGLTPNHGKPKKQHEKQIFEYKRKNTIRKPRLKNIAKTKAGHHTLPKKINKTRDNANLNPTQNGA